MQRIYQKHSKGFTLIELVIVIAILGILAGIAIPRFEAAQEEARGAKFLSDMRTIESAVNMYAARNGSYPAFIDPWKGAPKGYKYSSTAALVPEYLAAWPEPPAGIIRFTGKNGQVYRYILLGKTQKDDNPYCWFADGGNAKNKSEYNSLHYRVVLGHMSLDDYLEGKTSSWVQKLSS